MSIKQAPYISWSQLSTWERDKNLYYELYVLGQKLPETPSLVLGKWVADELKKPVSKSKIIEYFRKYLPQCEEREREMSANLEGVNLLGYYDGLNQSKDEIIEIKTGFKWTQAMVDKHGQLDFYALMYWLRYKKLPKSVLLIWLKTEKDNNGDVFLTGDFKIFKRKITMQDIIKISGRIKKAWTGIKAMYEMLNK